MSIASHRFDNELRYRAEDHVHQTQLTPPYVLEPVRAALGGTIWLDPCSTPDNPCRAKKFYYPPVDGVTESWLQTTIFCNPPYGKARERWVERCIQCGVLSAKVILLIPAHPDTRTFQRAAKSASFVVFIKGRVKFGVLRPNRRQVAASHPSALICWNADPEPLRHLGVVMSTARQAPYAPSMPPAEETACPRSTSSTTKTSATTSSTAPTAASTTGADSDTSAKPAASSRSSAGEAPSPSS